MTRKPIQADRELAAFARFARWQVESVCARRWTRASSVDPRPEGSQNRLSVSSIAGNVSVW